MSKDKLPVRDNSGKTEAAVQGAVGRGLLVSLEGGNIAGLRVVSPRKDHLKVIEGGAQS